MAEGGSVSGVVGAPSSANGDDARARSFIERALLRRRLRFLQRRRELALHDLGGFVFEAHRQGEAREELTHEKLDAVAAIDDELAKLQHALDVREELTVLREPGVSSCPQCATIHDSAANYCPGCGRRAAAADR